nr:hypothetical protein [Tanacetum cinerariifolium]
MARNFNLLGAVGRGPRMLTPQWRNGYVFPTVSVGRISMNFFIFSKASSTSIIYFIVVLSVQLLSALKKGRDFSAPFDKNRLSVVSFPLRLCTSLSVLGGSRSVTALTFEGLALIPCLVIRCLRNGPSSMPKDHFFGLSFMLINRNLSKVSCISFSISFSEVLLITMSSTMPAFISSSTSLHVTALRSGPNPRFFCYMLKHFPPTIMVLEIPVMSA